MDASGTSLIPRPLGCLTRAAVPSITSHTIACDAEPVSTTSSALTYAPSELAISRGGGEMRGFLTRIIDRRMRRLALGATFGVAVGTTGAMSTGEVDDSRFQNADLAAERAEILLTDACGERAGAACEKRLQKALELLSRVRKTLNQAPPAAARSD